METFDYEYELTDRQLLRYSSLPAVAKLKWLDDARRFTLLARKARVARARAPEPPEYTP